MREKIIWRIYRLIEQCSTQQLRLIERILRSIVDPPSGSG